MSLGLVLKIEFDASQMRNLGQMPRSHLHSSDPSAKSTVANSLVELVCDSEYWTCFGVG